MVENKPPNTSVSPTEILGLGTPPTNDEKLSVKSSQVVPVPVAKSQQITRRNFGILPIPRRLRYDSEHPAHFGLLLNVVFGLSSTFIVANLYYCQPLLSLSLLLWPSAVEFAKSFNVTYGEVSIIPTLVQAGYASGLLFISPLGDLVRRRPLLLLLCSISTSLTVGLAITRSLVVFETLCYLIGASSVAPQILIPLAADLTPPSQRASAISIVLSGLLFGILIARVLAGIVAQYVTWRVVYYLAIGVQSAVVAMLWATLPDYPAKNKNLTYMEIIWTMARLAVTEPVLIQASLISMASSACFTCYWVTLTFLLGGPPYHYSTLVIGLFGLVGMFGVSMTPLVGRLIDRFVPWYASLLSTLGLLAVQGIFLGAAGVTVAAVVIVTVGLDVSQQMQQVSLTTSVYGISESARARLNAVLILSIFIGQVIGTSLGTRVFVSHGWRASAWLMFGWTAWQIALLLIRGPHCKRYTWFGYEGGTKWRKSVVETRASNVEEEKSTNQAVMTELAEAPGDEKLGDVSAKV
ncbi:major facilitator superfamily domain-containing protein [Multifurca ochricompacta]|uniref:Major facilitator superfamily domain-containing protein n=1 Tax=Multifurca ochricompacta TaxID=376703 RepID=A0AAD4LWZ2_9AGAM|nr:major facilitator superfamily domain-containing protein [Multifurca ochricompacta]